MRRYVVHTLFTLLCFLSAGLHAQDIPALNITAQDGLPSNTIYEIYRDSKGYLWFATDRGIARYNGLKFEVFTTYNGLADNEVFFFQEDKAGRLWFGTFNGQLCYYQDDRFHNASNTPSLNVPYKFSFIQNIIPLPDSSVMIGFQSQGVFLNIKKNGHTAIIIPDISAANPFFNALSTPDSGFKFLFKDNTVIADAKGKIISNVPQHNQPTDRLFAQNTIYFYNDSAMFVGDNEFIGRFRQGFFSKYLLHRIYAADGNLLLATNSSLIINDSIEIFKGNKISSVTQDNQGNYWIGSTTNGAFVIKKKFINTQHFGNTYTGTALYAVKHKQDLFFSTSRELFHMRDKKVEVLTDYQRYTGPVNSNAREPQIYIDSTFHFYYFSTSEIITANNILDRNARFLIYPTPGASAKAIVAMNDGLYIKGISYIFKFPFSATTGTNKPPISKVCDVANRERIFGTAKSADGHLWYSTISGMHKLEGAASSLQPQFKKSTLKYFAFFGQYLVGYTHNNQLLIYTNYDKMLKVDTVTSQNCIWDKFYQLDASHILISTNNLYRLLTLDNNKESPGFSVSVVEDPFIPLHAEAICTDSGNCYFIKDGAVTSINLDIIFSKPAAPQLLFKTLKTSNKAYAIHDVVSIPYREAKAISISFATLAFSGKDIFYQYSISKNTDDNWTDLVGDINLVHTSYGTYKIKVRAKSYSSDYSSPSEFTMVIARPYWATWWFVLADITLVILIVFAVVRYRIVMLLRKKEKKHKAEVRFMKSEYKALNALMNPHFIFNTLNNVQDLINKNDRLAANEYLRIFADLVRQNMHNISMELIPLQKEVDLVRNYLLLEKLRFEDKLNYDIDVERGVDLTEIFVPPLLLQPIVENSIKHGILHLTSGDGFVYLKIYERDNTIFLQVKDNGVGMDFKRENEKISHESFGLDNIRKRLRQLSLIQNKQFSLDISEEKDADGVLLWTIVTVSIPVS